MKINELKCSATLQHGQLVLDDGTYIDLHEVYGVLAELREYAVSSTLEGDDTPDCVFEADKLLAAFS